MPDYMLKAQSLIAQANSKAAGLNEFSDAVLIGQNTTYVYVIKDDSTAEMRPVKVARTVDGISVISDGLNPGERVAIDGQLRLTTGSRVDIRSSSDKPETDSKS